MQALLDALKTMGDERSSGEPNATLKEKRPAVGNL